MSHENEASRIANRMAEKLRKASERAEEQRARESGKQLLTQDYERVALGKAPSEFKRLGELLRQVGDVFNAKKSEKIPELRYSSVNPRLEAGIYAFSLQARELLQAFEVDVCVGIRGNADQFMDEVPDVPPTTWRYRAAGDDTGFFWLEQDTQKRCTPDQVIEHAFEALCKLLAADL